MLYSPGSATSFKNNQNSHKLGSCGPLVRLLHCPSSHTRTGTSGGGGCFTDSAMSVMEDWTFSGLKNTGAMSKSIWMDGKQPPNSDSSNSRADFSQKLERLVVTVPQAGRDLVI